MIQDVFGRTLKDRGIDRPIHRGPHPILLRELNQRLELIRVKLGNTSFDGNGTAYSEYAKHAIRDLEKQLRDDMYDKLKIGLLPDQIGSPYG